MIITEKNRYLIIPVSRIADEKRICFYSGDVLLMDIVVCVDFDNPDFVAHYDMKTFMGKDISVLCDDIVFETSDCIKNDEEQEVRPEYHFAAKRGWTNDPNGLVFYENKYHMFYQHNPIGAVRGSEHWGHAVSDDLLCWKECEIALFPDDMGTMFSGSAIEDKENVLGMKENEHNPFVLFYTASGGERSLAAKGKPFVQCMAISTDGGRTFEKYKNNPIIGEISQRSRDPKVVYDKKHKLFIMVLFSDVDYTNNYTLFKSKNLIDWTKICDFVIPGERECPDFYVFEDKRKWVFFGGCGSCVIAELDLEKGFVNVSEPQKISYASYAAQSFNGFGKCIRISWARLSMKPMTEWGKSSLIPTKTYSQFMSIPAEVTLEDGVVHVSPMYDFTAEKSYSNISANNVEIPLLKRPAALYIKTKLCAENLKIKLFGNVVEIDKNTVRFCNFLGDVYEMPYDGEIKIFADNIGYDIFVSDKFCASYQAVSDYDDNVLSFEGNAIIEKLEVGQSIFVK